MKLPVRDRQKFGFSRTWKMVRLLQTELPTLTVGPHRLFLLSDSWKKTDGIRQFSPENLQGKNRLFGPSVRVERSEQRAPAGNSYSPRREAGPPNHLDPAGTARQRGRVNEKRGGTFFPNL